jgi:hypothetical protein
VGFVNLSRHFEVPPERVFATVTDPSRLATWLTLVEELNGSTPTLQAVGDGFQARMRLGHRHLDVAWRVTKVIEDRVLLVEGSGYGDGGSAAARFEFGAWDGGCQLEVELEYELPGGFVTELADRLWVERSIAHDLERSLDRLQELTAPLPA